MKCLKCNFENPDGSVFCAGCGNKLEQQVNNQNFNQVQMNQQPQQTNVVPTVLEQSSAMKGKKNNILWIVLIIFAVIIVLVMGVFMVVGNAFNNLKDMFESGIQEELVDDEENNIPEIVNPAYTVGDEITLLDGSSWYYVSSDSNKVVLLSKTNYGEDTYFCSDGRNMYDTSHVRDVVENQYLPTVKNSISAAGGDTTTTTARILSVDDIKSIINSQETNPRKIEISSSYRWLFETGSYWLSTHSYDSLYNSAYIVESWGSFAYINLDIAGLNMGWGNEFNVRPVLETSINNIQK